MKLAKESAVKCIFGLMWAVFIFWIW